jgi:ATP-dependent RNA helicase RhlE
VPFTSFGLHPLLLRGVRELGFTRPTPIQLQAIPPAMEGRDLLACAATGSGKTAAFVLPIVHRLMEKPRRTTRALVLTPTRELAAQIQSHLEDLAVHTPVTGCAVFGGVGMGPQEHALRAGVDVIAATPGRLLDHFRFRYAALEGLEVLVLDEADRMLDMGFLPDIRKILRHLPARRQTLFFSATMPSAIAELAREMLRDPVTINMDRRPVPPVGITQAMYPVNQQLKAVLLLALLRRGDIESALVFTRTKHRANRLADWLAKQGVSVGRIHGNRSQAQRTQALDGFRSGRFAVLVATDIAARGIDVEALGHVINFDVPLAPDDYIHRVGRTGRAEATGDAFTFVAPEEESSVRAIERALGKALPRVLLPDFDYGQKPPSLAPHSSPPSHDSRHAAGRKRSPEPPRGGARGPGRPAGSGRRSEAPGSWGERLQSETRGQSVGAGQGRRPMPGRKVGPAPRRTKGPVGRGR